MTINQCMALLVAELLAAGVPDPLGSEFTLAAVWDDLARLAGEQTPVEVLAALGEPLGETRQPHRAPASPGAEGGGSTVNGVLGEFLARLRGVGLCDALTRRVVLEPFWATLSRIAGEVVVSTVHDLPARRNHTASSVGTTRLPWNHPAEGEGR